MEKVKMKVLVILLALTSAVFAQQPMPQGADPEFLGASLDALADQRNRAANEAAIAEAKLTQIKKVNADLQKQIADAQKIIADLQKQIVDKPKEEPKQ
jgi:septal ring factor EnvC (AmiA/AmiB activator)